MFLTHVSSSWQFTLHQIRPSENAGVVLPRDEPYILQHVLSRWLMTRFLLLLLSRISGLYLAKLKICKPS